MDNLYYTRELEDWPNMSNSCPIHKEGIEATKTRLLRH